MFKQLIIFGIVVLSLHAHNCDLAITIFYHGLCVPKECLTDRLGFLDLLLTSPPNIGTISNGITYSVAQPPGPTLYKVTVQYGNPLGLELTGGINCVTEQLYQTVSSTNHARLNVLTPGGTPTWPISSYNYLAPISTVQFDITPLDLITHSCEKFATPGLDSYHCNFELAFLLSDQTEASYYFEVQINVHTNTETSSLDNVDFLKIVQIQSCVSNCQVEVNVDSSLEFCPDEFCLTTSLVPYSDLYLNKEVFLKHSITDPAFSTWYINSVKLHFATLAIDIEFGSNDFTIESHEQGYNIYSFGVPVAEDDVHIHAHGIVSTTAIRMLQEESKPEQNVVNSQIVLGQVTKNPPTTNSDLSAYSSASSGIVEQKGNENQANGSDLMMAGTVALLLLIV